MKKQARPHTTNQGANDERTAILAYIKRLRRDRIELGLVGEVNELNNVIVWIEHRAERNAKRTGGLGRK